MSTYKKLDLDTYYRKGVYERFTKIARCSVSITGRIDITGLYEYSKRTGTKFYINFPVNIQIKLDLIILV